MFLDLAWNVLRSDLNDGLFVFLSIVRALVDYRLGVPYMADVKFVVSLDYDSADAPTHNVVKFAVFLDKLFVLLIVFQ